MKDFLSAGPPKWAVIALVAFAVIVVLHHSVPQSDTSTNIARTTMPTTSTPGMSHFTYFACDGGPHLVLPKAVAAQWNGSDALGLITGKLTGDYGRACAVPAPFGMIPIGNNQALVLAESPPMSAWGRSPDGDGVDVYLLESWKTTNLDALIESAIAATPTTSMIDSKIIWTFDAIDAVLMFAGDKIGSSAYGQLDIALPAGKYRILKSHYNDPQGTLWIIRLKKMAN